MKVLIFDNSFSGTGHPVAYASLVARAVLSKNHQVTVAFDEAVKDSPSINEYFSDSDLNIDQLFFPTVQTTASPRQRLRVLADTFEKVVAQVGPEYVLIPTGDLLATACGWERMLRRRRDWHKLPVDVMLIRGEFAYDHGSLKHRIWKKIKWYVSSYYPWTRMGILDPIAWTSKKRPNSNLELCPDPVPPRPPITKKAARAVFGLPEDARLIVSTGNQNKLKGIDLLINAFASSNRWKESDRLVLIGHIDDPIKEVLKHAGENLPAGKQIICIDRFVTDDEFHSSILAADVVAVPYRKTNRPSGIVCRSVAWGVPIVGTDSGWPKWACLEFQAGVAVDIYDQEKFADSLATSLENSDSFTQSENAVKFAEFNTVKNFEDFWCDGIQRMVGEESSYKRYDELIPDSNRSGS